MGDARKPAALDEHAKKMDPANFAYISDDTYTAEEVEAQTQVGCRRRRDRRLAGYVTYWLACPRLCTLK